MSQTQTQQNLFIVFQENPKHCAFKDWIRNQLVFECKKEIKSHLVNRDFVLVFSLGLLTIRKNLILKLLIYGKLLKSPTTVKMEQDKFVGQSLTHYCSVVY